MFYLPWFPTIAKLSPLIPNAFCCLHFPFLLMSPNVDELSRDPPRLTRAQILRPLLDLLMRPDVKRTRFHFAFPAPLRVDEAFFDGDVELPLG